MRLLRTFWLGDIRTANLTGGLDTIIQPSLYIKKRLIRRKVQKGRHGTPSLKREAGNRTLLDSRRFNTTLARSVPITQKLSMKDLSGWRWEKLHVREKFKYLNNFSTTMYHKQIWHCSGKKNHHENLHQRRSIHS